MNDKDAAAESAPPQVNAMFETARAFLADRPNATALQLAVALFPGEIAKPDMDWAIAAAKSAPTQAAHSETPSDELKAIDEVLCDATGYNDSKKMLSDYGSRAELVEAIAEARDEQTEAAICLTARIAELEEKHESDYADYAIVKDNYGQALRNVAAAEAELARLRRGLVGDGSTRRCR